MTRRALLLSGGVNRALDRPRYANDLGAYYRMLAGVYGHAAVDIRVCDGAGGARRLHGDAPLPVEPARRADVLAALEWLAELGEGDQAFLMVTDHGEPEGICLWGHGQHLSPDDLARPLRSSAATKVLVFGQCYSGRFGDMALQRAVICCACDADGSSFPVPRPASGVEPPYSEFLYQLAGALAGEYPDHAPLPLDAGQLSPPGRISIGEAFRFARDHDRWVTGMRRVHELPRLFDPGAIADGLTL